MKQYSVKNKCFRDHRKTRCINPRYGKWVELYREKNCPDAVCPLCGSKQRAIVELCSLRPENLAAFSHLLHEAQPAVSLSECRKQCKGISKDNPYRLQLAGRRNRMICITESWSHTMRKMKQKCLSGFFPSALWSKLDPRKIL